MRIRTVTDLTSTRIERRADAPSSVVGTLYGYAAVFEQRADMYWFAEEIAPGAFAESIAQDDVRALWNHDQSSVLGRNIAGTLRLAEDPNGLAIEIDLPDTQVGRDAAVSVSRGDVSQMSFMFEALDAEWRTEGGLEIRRLTKVKLYEVSPVTFPAYEGTDVALRARDREKEPDVVARKEQISSNLGVEIAHRIVQMNARLVR